MLSYLRDRYIVLNSAGQSCLHAIRIRFLFKNLDSYLNSVNWTLLLPLPLVSILISFNEGFVPICLVLLEWTSNNLFTVLWGRKLQCGWPGLSQALWTTRLEGQLKMVSCIFKCWRDFQPSEKFRRRPGIPLFDSKCFFSFILAQHEAFLKTS